MVWCLFKFLEETGSMESLLFGKMPCTCAWRRTLLATNVGGPSLRLHTTVYMHIHL